MSDQLVLRSHELVERNQRLLTETRVYIALSSDRDEGAHLSATCDVSLFALPLRAIKSWSAAYLQPNDHD